MVVCAFPLGGGHICGSCVGAVELADVVDLKLAASI